MDLAADRDDELQDLSPQDAEEIRAFLEKRRWFEGKLKILESLPPIYPFLHPSLGTASDGDHDEGDICRRIGAADAQWSLPALDQLREWQRERDALEEEVLSFDGGDLGRMKETTRAATLLPLTPPSTHLVSITLALIVLIDRLLTLLRQRSDLLELTALRLTWDTLRWQVMQESRRIRNEINDIITSKGRWVPPDAKSIIPRASSSSIRASATSGDACTSKEALRTPETRPSALPRPTNGHKSLDPPDSPISPRTAAPRRSLALPILHSQITNLQIRHRNLASTALSRSGAILDKMIDHAGPLRDLGGVNGPTTDVQEGGAVPDELLDIQDELEGDCEKVRALVEWCKQLEQQWNSADEHYAASIKARHSALDVLSRLQSALDEPATSEQHLQLSSLLATAQSTLPEEIDGRFPRPSHPAYPANDEHNSHVVDTLRVARCDASADIKLTTEALAWYERLSAARAALLQHVDKVNGMESALSDARDRVLTGTAATPRPVIDASEPSHPVVDWIAFQQSSTQEGKQLCSQVTTLIQHTSVANMRYRQLLRAAPNNLLEVVPAPHHDASDAAEVATGSLLDLVQTLQAAINIAEQDAELWPMVVTFDSSAASLVTKVDRLYATIASAVDEDAWIKSKFNAVRGDDLASAVSELGQEITRDVEGPHRAIEALLRNLERDTPLLRNRLAKTAETFRHKHKMLCRLADLAQRVRAQATIVRLIQQEAEEMISAITGAQARLERPIGKSDPESKPSIQELRIPVEISQSLEQLEQRARDWESALANRVPLIASTSVANGSDGASPAPLPPNSSATDPPMNPPATPPPSSPDIQPNSDTIKVGTQPGPKLDLTFLDREVRQEINETAARVWSALRTARVAEKTYLLNQWRAGADDAEQNVRAIVAEASQSLDEAQARRGLVDAGARSGSIEDLQRCLGLAEDLCKSGAALVSRFQGKLDGAIGDLYDWTGDAAVCMVPGVDRRDLETYAYTRRTASALLTKLSNFEAEAKALVATLHAQLARAQAAAVQTEPVPADVFGSRLPRPSSSRKTRRSKSPDFGDPDLNAILRLRKRIDSLRIGELVSPSTSVLQSTPGSRKLPTESVSRRVNAEVNAVALAARSMDPTSSQRAADAMEELRKAIDAAEQDLPLLDQLSELSTKIQTCDTALSQSIDALDHEAGEQLDNMFRVAERAFDAATSHARPLQSDRRVASEMRRLEVAFDELKALRSGAPEVDFDDAASDATSIAYGSVSSRLTLHPNKSSLSVRSGTSVRSASNPVASQRPALPQFEPRNRTVSETPARARLNSTLPRSRVDSMAERPSSIPRPVRLSQVSSSHALNASTSSKTLSATPRSGKTSMLPVKTPNKPVKAYVPHPKSKLDLAVGRVVNKLKVNVPVVPVGMGAKDEWKDQTGRYWIGAEGRAKLYFCRILRSKTVMVRVGGGWVELSKFLLDHFADALWDTPFTAASVPGTPIEPIGSSRPVTITSASLNAPAITPGKPRSRLPSAVTTATPPPLPTPAGPSTPTQYISQSPVSPSASASPNKSPLVPLHFIRKASESPPVREREKAKYKIGKRSILGKEPSWSEPQEH